MLIRRNLDKSLKMLSLKDNQLQSFKHGAMPTEEIFGDMGLHMQVNPEGYRARWALPHP